MARYQLRNNNNNNNLKFHLRPKLRGNLKGTWRAIELIIYSSVNIRI